MTHIFITGVSSGIGKYLGQKLGEFFLVSGAGRKSEVPDQIKRYFQGDLQDISFLEQIGSIEKDIDYLILNAGVGYFGEFKNIDMIKHQKVLYTNLWSPICLCHLLLRKQKIKKGIVFIGSIAGKKSFKHGASYAASKFGLRGFAMQLKNELPHIKIHILNPKIVDTHFHKAHPPKNLSLYQQTSLESIFETIQNIITKKEHRFEIDL